MNFVKNKISVIVPLYNSCIYIADTIKSVISQTYDNWELIIVDDGSSDGSLEIAKEYVDNQKTFLFTHANNVNKGVSKTRELGVSKATGEFISFLDADDLFMETKLEKQIAVFKNNKNVVLTHSKVELINDSKTSFFNDFSMFEKDKKYSYRTQNNWMNSNGICNSTVIVRSKELKGLSFGLPQLFQYEDWLLWNLLGEKGDFYYLNEPLGQYRMHDESATAAVLKNKLVAPFSKIELLLSYYLLSENFNSQRHNVIKLLKNSLIDLLKVYSSNNLEIVDSFTSDVYSGQDSESIYQQKYEELKREHLKLKDDYGKRKKIKRWLQRILKLN